MSHATPHQPPGFGWLAAPPTLTLKMTPIIYLYFNELFGAEEPPASTGR